MKLAQTVLQSAHLGHSEVPLCLSVFGQSPGPQEGSQGWAGGGEVG